MSFPKVSIIVTSYCPESKPYLDLCIKSIGNLCYPNYETIIVGRGDYLPHYLDCQTIAPPQDEFWNSVGLNYGVANAHFSSEYYFLINDDTILTRGCLLPLIEALENSRIGQVMPVSNDMQGRYWIPELDLKAQGGFNLEMASKSIGGLMSFNSGHSRGMIFCETLCLYAQLISKKVWNEVGPFDETLTGQDDIDYSLRVAQKGYINAIELSSLVWHFGGVSAALTLTDEKRKTAMETFNKKWGINS